MSFSSIDLWGVESMIFFSRRLRRSAQILPGLWHFFFCLICLSARISGSCWSSFFVPQITQIVADVIHVEASYYSLISLSARISDIRGNSFFVPQITRIGADFTGLDIVFAHNMSLCENQRHPRE